MASEEQGIRDRILDAAAACYVERGPSGTLHRTIAERAELSRPTVYKYVGDQAAITSALLERELDRFFAAVAEVIAREVSVRDRFVEALAFTVAHAASHDLFQRLLADQPEAVLPWLTSHSAPVIERAVEVASPQLARAIEHGELRPVDPRVAAEWIARLAISLITTPSVTADLTEPVRLRRFVDDLFTVGLAGVERGGA